MKDPNTQSPAAYWYEQNRGLIRNLAFPLFVGSYQLFLGNYLLHQCGLYMEALPNVPLNKGLGYFLLLIFLLDFLVFQLKYREVKYTFLHNQDVLLANTGFLRNIQVGIIRVSAFFTIMTGIFLQLMITNATGDMLAGLLVLIFVFVKWVYIIFRVYTLTHYKPDPAKPVVIPEPLTTAWSIASDVLLTLTSSVIFTVVWEQLCVRGSGMLALFFFCIPVYLPTRLIFILQDFYSPNSVKHKRRAFFSSLLALLIPMLSAFAHSDQKISYAPKVVLDDFSASDTLLAYPNKKFNNFIFCKKSNLSVAESDSFAHAFFRNGYFNPTSQKSAAIRKDSAGYIVTITLDDNKARGNEKMLAPFRKLRDELQQQFPDQKIRIWIGGYKDGGNIIARLE